MAVKRKLGLPTQDTQRPYIGQGSNITGGTGVTTTPKTSVADATSNQTNVDSGVVPGTVNRTAIDEYNAQALKANKNNASAYNPTPLPASPVTPQPTPSTFSDNITKPASIRDRMVSIQPQSTTVDNMAKYNELNGPSNLTAPGQTVDKPNLTQSGSVAGSYKDNGDGTFTQYMSDGTTTTTNTKPLTGQDIKAQQAQEDRAIMSAGLSTPAADNIAVGGLQWLDKTTKDYQSNADQLQANIDLAKEKKRLALDNLRINLNSDIDEVQRQADRSINSALFQGAMSGAGQSSAFGIGLQNLRDDANKTLDKLNNLYNNAVSLTGLEADKAIADYNRALEDARRQFDYDHRDIIQGANYDLNEIIKNTESMGVKFDPEKVNGALGALAIKIQQARADTVAKYLDNSKKITDDLNARIAGDQALFNLNQAKTAQLTTKLDASDGAAVSSLTNKDIDSYVQQGLLTPAQAAGYKMQGLQKAHDTLVAYAGTRTYDGKIINPGQVSEADLRELQSYIDQGYSYTMAVDKVIANHPDRYNNQPVISPMDQANINQSNAAAALANANTGKVKADTNSINLQNQLTQQSLNNTNNLNAVNEIISTINNPQTQQEIYDYSKAQRNGDETLQCGELVNDYIKLITGKKGRMGNTYDSKIKAIGDIGKSATPQIGGVFVQQFGSTGHTGIVTGVNPDGSINVYDANFINFNKDNGAKPVSRTILAKDIVKMTFSKSPVQDLNTKQRSLDLILASGGFTKDQATAVRESIKNGQDPATTIKKAITQSLPGPVKDDLVKVELAKGQMSELDKSLKEFYANGGKSNVFKGTIEKTIQRLGETTDPKLASIAVKVATALQTYRNAVSGTAFSVQEGKEMASVFPGIDKGEILNNVIVKARKDMMDRTINDYYITGLSGNESLRNDIKSLEGGGNSSSSSNSNSNPSGPNRGRAQK